MSSFNTGAQTNLHSVGRSTICGPLSFSLHQHGQKKESDDLHIATYNCKTTCNTLLLSMSGYSSCLLNGMQVLHSVLYSRHGLDALLLQILA
jgi:hypothetical protein